jgi:AraC family transcriptional activator of pobA
MPDEPPWTHWQFTLSSYYDHAVAPGNRVMSVRDVMLVGWQIRRGAVDLAWSGGRLRAVPGDWVLLPPSLARQHRFSSDAEIRSLRCRLVGSGGQPPLHDRQPMRLPADARLAALADAVAAALRPRHDLISWAAQQAAVLQWSAAVCRLLGLDAVIAPSDARVESAQRLLSGRLAPAVLPWAELRAATGLSRPHLDRLFRLHSGHSVRAWCEQRLTDRACTALGDPGAAVKRIAGDLGFGDPSHFCRWFRRQTGISPAEWRRRGGI